MGPRWLPAAAVTVLAAALAWFNRGERVAVDLGIFTFYRAPLAVVLLLVFLAGMLAMLGLSLRHDRRVRDELRRHGLLQPALPAPRPAASAWGVVPESAPGREDEPRTLAYLDSADAPEHGDRTAAYAEPAPARDGDERTVAYPREPASTGDEDERTVAYPRYDEEPKPAREQDERTVIYPRLDEDPAT